jgi:hypothetical protein
VPLPENLRRVRWDEHDGRRIEVASYRCLACASADAVKRTWAERHEKDKPAPGQAAPADGVVWATHPHIEEEV